MTFWHLLRSFIRPPRPVQDFWRRPNWRNRPEAYLADGQTRSQFLLRLLMGTDITIEDSILELGCNAGRNLVVLHHAGFRRLVGIEINADAIALFRQRFPNVARDTALLVGAMEEILPFLGSRQFKAIVTMAVLEHVPYTSNGVFADIARVLRDDGAIITIEDEVSQTPRHFPRNYKQVFGDLGFVEAANTSCERIPGLDEKFMARVFHRF